MNTQILSAFWFGCFCGVFAGVLFSVMIVGVVWVLKDKSNGYK